MSKAERVAATLDTMVAQESPAHRVDMVDILSGRDGDEVEFTAAWQTFS